MADYTPQIDSQIAQMLKLRGAVTPGMISGVSEQEAHDFLRMYVNSHPDEQLTFDGISLTAGMPTLAEEPVPQAATPAHIPDLTPREEPSGWLWLLPIILGWIGGIIAWAVAKDKNSQIARNMLVTGIVLSVIWACLFVVIGIYGPPPSSPTDTSWPATGRVTFYYFGTPS